MSQFFSTLLRVHTLHANKKSLEVLLWKQFLEADTIGGYLMVATKFLSHQSK